AIEHNVERLHEDHANAQIIAQAIRETEGLRLDPPDVETNIIWFQVEPELGTAAEVATRIKPHGVLLGVGGPQTLRACTHLDVSQSMAKSAAEIIHRVVPTITSGRSEAPATSGAVRY